eukprot:2187457-Amphidinium_carterae.1
MTGMGGWVMRSDEKADRIAFKEASRLLVERHEALRTEFRDSQRVLSMLLDTGILFTLVARRLDACGALVRQLRRWVSHALCRCWPRLTILPAEVVYHRHPDFVPFEAFSVKRQPDMERALKSRRNLIATSQEPVDIALVQLEANLV